MQGSKQEKGPHCLVPFHHRHLENTGNFSSKVLGFVSHSPLVSSLKNTDARNMASWILGVAHLLTAHMSGGEPYS